jgi:hypothetical protein
MNFGKSMHIHQEFGVFFSTPGAGTGDVLYDGWGRNLTPTSYYTKTVIRNITDL